MTPTDVRTKESNLLKQQFDELVHDESVAANSIEEIFDIQFRRPLCRINNSDCPT